LNQLLQQLQFLQQLSLSTDSSLNQLQHFLLSAGSSLDSSGTKCTDLSS
jgi:hypothetical protein